MEGRSPANLTKADINANREEEIIIKRIALAL
jgi:hypothetical protein